MYTLKGEIKVIYDIQQISESFKKCEFVVTDASGQYPQTILFQAVQDRSEQLKDFKVGDQVEVTFFLRGREWTNPKDGSIRFFNSLDVWKVEPLGGKAASTPDAVPAENTEALASDGDDDLPF